VGIATTGFCHPGEIRQKIPSASRLQIHRHQQAAALPSSGIKICVAPGQLVFFIIVTSSDFVI
jgi:hypothetical protein